MVGAALHDHHLRTVATATTGAAHRRAALRRRATAAAGGGHRHALRATGSAAAEADRLVERAELALHCAAPRALLRPTPPGRSLNTVSPLSSRPVVML